MGEARNRNIRIGIVDNDPYALKVFGALIERMSSDFAVIWTCDLGAVAISRCLAPPSGLTCWLRICLWAHWIARIKSLM